ATPCVYIVHFFFSSRRRHTRSKRDWSSDVCSSDLNRYAPLLNDFTSLENCSNSVSCIVCVGLISGSLSPFIEIPLYINLNRTLLTVYMIKMIITCVWYRKRAVLYIVQKVIKNVVVTIGGCIYRSSHVS